MTGWRPYAATLACSTAIHALVLANMRQAPPHKVLHRPPVKFTIQRAPPPRAPPPISAVKQATRRATLRRPAAASRPQRPPPLPSLPPPPVAQPPSAPAAAPVFGMASTVNGASPGLAAPLGNTLQAAPSMRRGGGTPGAGAAHVAAYQVTRLPRIRGECTTTYPSEAHVLGLQGSVTLDVEVCQDGHVGEVRILHGPGHGLDEAAALALKACLFAPAELNGVKVATRIVYLFRFVSDS